ncbi:MAG: hypothetical protein JW767_09335, partial [Thermoleophilia bacterium]|nr:hypothetical protein [Thermoleophilia bacterium]
MGGEGGTAPERLGAPCDSDGDCTAPATCVGPGATAFLGGGLARGACLVDCTEGAAACDAFSNAVCVDTSPPGSEGERAFCFEGCRFGSLEQSKCEGRTDAACERLEGGDGDEGFCRPMCAADGDCGDGRVCDPRLGACIPETSELPEFELGAACVTESESEDCAGVCLGAAGETGVCTARCVFGSREPCGDAAERSACLLTTPGGTVGDVGYCVALCDCDGDCTTSETGCVPLGDATLEAVFGARGVCAVGGEGGAAGTLA